MAARERGAPCAPGLAARAAARHALADVALIGPQRVADAERRAARACRGAAARALCRAPSSASRTTGRWSASTRRRERGVDLRRRRDRAAQGAGLRSSRSSVDEAGRLSTWADVQHRACAARRLPAAAAGALDRHAASRSRSKPAPTARRERAQLHRALHAAPTPATRPRRLTLALALRPWQVNPPHAVPQHRRAASSRVRRARVARRHAARRRPAVAARRDAADARSALPRSTTAMRSSSRCASAAAARDAGRSAGPCERGAALALRARAGRVAQRRGGAAAGPARRACRPAPMRELDARSTPSPHAWRERLNRVDARACRPPAQPIADTLRSALAQILMSRDGAGAAAGHAQSMRAPGCATAR